MRKNEVYTELSIQIGVLEAKVDKMIQLLLEQKYPMQYLGNPDYTGLSDEEIFSLEHNNVT